MDSAIFYKSAILSQGGILIALMIFLLYILKGKKAKISYRYISTLVILILILLFENMLPVIITNMSDHPSIYTFLCRFYIALLNIYKIQIFIIVNIACSKTGKEFGGSKIAKYATYILGYSLIAILCLTLPINYQIGGGKPIVVRGLITLFSNILAGLISFFELYFIVRSKKKNVQDSIAPLIFCLSLYIIVTILQMVYGYYLNIAGVFDASLLMIAYLTFENQDYKLMEEAQTKKHDIELKSMKKDKELNDIYFNIRSEVSTILDYSKIVDDNENISDEELDEIIKGVTNSTKNLVSITNTIKEGDSNAI